jgi:hypothetical protein
VLEALPATVEPWLRERLERGERLPEEEWDRPRFVGVDLSIGEAYAMLERLRQAGATGHLVPGRYRTPRLSLEESLRIAEQAIRDHVAKSRALHSFRFEPVRHNRQGSTLMYRAFQAYSPDMDEASYCPASVSVYVDTQDGRLWEHRELSLLQEALEDEGRRALGLPRTEAPEGSSRQERRKCRGQLKRVKR